ncbi:MAG TPA: hypothetical protein VF368_04345 [Gemmatimonadaceae bacterium]|jgi:hypothetical protein
MHRIVWRVMLGVDGEGTDVHFAHNARGEGFVASLDLWSKRGQGIVVLTNGVSGQLLSEIQAAFRRMYALDKIAYPGCS